MFYRLAYAVGFTPWDRTGEPPGPDHEVLRMVAAEETGDPPYGPALDLGSGCGSFGIALAQRGWRVTGVDAVPRAVGFARRNAGRAGVDIRFLRGDVTRLAPEVGSDYRLVIDMGCLHGLGDEDRVAEVREQQRVTSSGAAVLLLAFTPPSGPGPRGITPEQVEALYAGWQLEEHRPLSLGDRVPRRFEPHLYRLRRP